jgi:hypothetical protein
MIYNSDTIKLVDDTEIYITPLKIRYLRQFMDAFEAVKTSKDDMEAMSALAVCAAISMQQYFPSIKTVEQLEDMVDMPTVYKILDVAAGIKISKPVEEESVKKQATDSGSTWETLDLAKLEAEVFLLGIWKDYEELELSLSMPELMSTLEIKRELDYNEKKFLAAMQGVDLDKQSGNNTNAWEEMKARVFSGGKAADANDVVALQGANAQKAGFGIGMGLGYEDLTKKPQPSVV